MSDSVTVTSSQSWFSRLMDSIKSVLVGLALFVVAFPVLFWNEGRAVRTARSLEEGAGSVVSVPADQVNAGNEGKLVHLTGPVSTQGELTDPDFGVHAQGVKLVRHVDMYQWKQQEKSEKRKKLGGGEETVTTYTYSKDWSSEPIDSSSFQESNGHQNPGSFPVEASTEVADPVEVGAFTLSTEQVDQLNDGKDLPVTEAMLQEVPEPLGSQVKVSDGRFYMGENPASPQVGDVRISFQVVNPATVSLIGVQTGKSFAAYQAKAGDTILLVDEGTHTAPEMFQAAQSRNTVLTWIVRAGGFLMMFIGLLAVFKPISVFGDVIPLVGTMLGAGLGVFSFLLSFALSIFTIAVAWIFYRPILGIVLLALALGGLLWLVSLGRKKKRQRLALPIPPPPPAPVPA
ncbi:MAG TPA: TMEM43 family protein [Thermoanaerobaculia bacterium]|nr:TMEM43 family protein [Thermoanaerobaculia bacterium]